MKKRTNILLAVILLFVSACAQNITENSLDGPTIPELSGLTFIYQLVGKNLSEKRIINDDSEQYFLPNIKPACNFHNSPNKEYVAYVKNVVINQYMDYEFLGQPIVTISNNMENNKTEIMKGDFDSIVFLTWIDNEKLDIDDYSYKYVESEHGEKYPIYADSRFDIYLDREILCIYKKNNLLKTIDISGCQCHSGLYITAEKDLHFVSELSDENDVSVIVKVNLDTDKIDRITNHKENQFIINYECYDF